jgi:hypothetical protein
MYRRVCSIDLRSRDRSNRYKRALVKTESQVHFQSHFHRQCFPLATGSVILRHRILHTLPCAFHINVRILNMPRNEAEQDSIQKICIVS